MFVFDRRRRKILAAILLALTPVFTAAAKVLNGDLEWRAAAAWLLLEFPVAVIAVLIEPPQAKSDGTDDIPPIKEQPNG